MLARLAELIELWWSEAERHGVCSMVDGGGDYPTRMHTNALAMRFMIDHFTHIIDWAHWALDVISDWPDSQSPARDWADEAGAIYRDVARHAVIDDAGVTTPADDAGAALSVTTSPSPRPARS